jgi:hypothetical protein
LPPAAGCGGGRARERALRETRSFWYGLRAQAIAGLFEGSR